MMIVLRMKMLLGIFCVQVQVQTPSLCKACRTQPHLCRQSTHGSLRTTSAISLSLPLSLLPLCSHSRLERSVIVILDMLEQLGSGRKALTANLTSCDSISS